ncbi:MAG: ABC transporter permease subunit [candidate division FCPU426 bacterium]
MKRRGTDPRTLLIDRLADWCISIGGLAVIAAVLGIFIFIGYTILPLFRAAKVGRPIAISPSGTLAVLVDEHQEKALLISAAGKAAFFDIASSALSGPEFPLQNLGVSLPTCSAVDNRLRLALGTQDGRVWTAQAGFKTRFDGDKRIQEPFIEGGSLQLLDPQKKAIRELRFGGTESLLIAGLAADGRVLIRQDRLNDVLEIPASAGNAVSLLVPDSADRVLLGTDTGHLLSFAAPGASPGSAKGWQLDQDLRVFEGKALTALGYPVGQQSVLCGSSEGDLVACFLIDRPEGGGRVFKVIHHFAPLKGPVLGFAASPRDKGFCAVTGQGALGLYFLTNERTLFQRQLEGDWKRGGLLMTPKADGILVRDGGGKTWLLGLDNPHPEVNFKALFSKIWYEGYDKPDYVWQSTGGSDDFEPKFSLTPLIYGTLKGTLYALLFAVPLAILAALYTSQFMSPRLRGVVKPVIEIMAAVPSVVMGFFAAMLLAPFMEKYLFTLLLGVPVLPMVVMATLWLWRSAPRHFSRKVADDSEILVLVLGLGVGITLLFLVGPVLEHALFLDLKIWMRAHFAVNYDQRNSLVVGFAMGFAVIPVIFTICEDALSAVPRHLVSASLSCGATPWQTALRVVLPVALSGIFSAVMVGFGRAVGETMIVLMATGNTPVMDLSAFNGFRALSANVAVEIPEAPVGGSLYRVLFLASLVLFMMTFAVNSVAEMIRLQLRKRYSQL